MGINNIITVTITGSIVTSAIISGMIINIIWIIVIIIIIIINISVMPISVLKKGIPNYLLKLSNTKSWWCIQCPQNIVYPRVSTSDLVHRLLERNSLQSVIPDEKRFGLFGVLTSSSTTRLNRGRVLRLTSDNFKCCHTPDSAGRPWILSQPLRILLIPIQPVGRGWPPRGLNLRSPL